jgi:hypothetical protein
MACSFVQMSSKYTNEIEDLPRENRILYNKSILYRTRDYRILDYTP